VTDPTTANRSTTNEHTERQIYGPDSFNKFQLGVLRLNVATFTCMTFSTHLTTLPPLYVNNIIYYNITYLLNPWSRVLLEKLIGLQLVKKFPAFYGTRRIIAEVTSARHLSLTWASSIQSIPPHPTSWRSILILSSQLRQGLAIGLFPSGFTIKTLYTPLPSPRRATCPAHLNLLDFITRTVLDEASRSWRYYNIMLQYVMLYYVII
jgi:hypothetical protein